MSSALQLSDASKALVQNPPNLDWHSGYAAVNAQQQLVGLSIGSLNRIFTVGGHKPSDNERLELLWVTIGVRKGILLLGQENYSEGRGQNNSFTVITEASGSVNAFTQSNGNGTVAIRGGTGTWTKPL